MTESHRVVTLPPKAYHQAVLRCWVVVAMFAMLFGVALDALAQNNATTSVDAGVRHNIRDLNEHQLDDLRKGIALMQSRPDGDPTSWTYWANIHHLHCQHGSWFFLPWHRMYLYYMEKVLREAIREATEDPNRSFTLPYWNYSVLGDSGRDARRIPVPYRLPATAENVLFVSDRNPEMNDGSPLDESAVLLDSLARVKFSSPPENSQSFGGQRAGPGHTLYPHSLFESTPHDVIHTDIGGWMARVRTAARDPLFWLHHANIDRLWEKWLSLGDGRSNPSGNQGAPWLEQSFEFYDADIDDIVTMTGMDVLDTVPQLGYRYDNLEGEMRPMTESSSPSGAEGQRSEPLILADRNVEIPIMNDRVMIDVEISRESDDETGELILDLSVQLDIVPPRHYEVYANLAEGETPHYSSDAYLGNMAFFGVEPSETAGYQYSLASTERRLRAGDAWNGALSFTLERAGPELRAEEGGEELTGWVRRVRITRR